ncbi:MAG: hypothetical protein E6J14_04500 [Chloroflexi bacterium]|nr:MAG: hypothetical protein E6J14_04500 [Chloroflexota bacterium]
MARVVWSRLQRPRVSDLFGAVWTRSSGRMAHRLPAPRGACRSGAARRGGRPVGEAPSRREPSETRRAGALEEPSRRR